MHKFAVYCFVFLVFSAPLFAKEQSQVTRALAAAQTQAQADNDLARSSLEASFYVAHQYMRIFPSNDELFRKEWEPVSHYIYKAWPSDSNAYYNNKYNCKVIESNEPLSGHTLLEKTIGLQLRPFSAEYKYLIKCKVYALTDKWAVMSGTCYTPQKRTEPDHLVINGKPYHPGPIGFHLEGPIKVDGKEVSAFYHSAELMLLYARPGSDFSRLLAQTPKIYLRILSTPSEIFALGVDKFIVNDSKRQLKGQMHGKKVTLDEEAWWTATAGRASDALFYQREGKNVIVGFNDAKFTSVPDIPDLRSNGYQCIRHKSSTYFTFSDAQLNFIRNTTGRDWDKVAERILITKKR